ncbi:MAG: hypothetical protein Q4A54_14775, partial [Parabacteroides sp.]|nr:hypothetical protein [Parabacteroides sp.]
RDNAEKYQWIEHQSWTYSRSFSVEETENSFIVFEGLDTYCDVLINGKKFSFDNMFIEHRINSDNLLKKGENKIEIIFYPPTKMVEGKEELSGAFTTERLHTRRIQCTYGWDWVQRFVTFGIFRSVYIEYEKGFSCKDVYIYTSHLDKYGAEVCAVADFIGHENGADILCEIKDDLGLTIYKKKMYVNTDSFRFDISISNPKLWNIENAENPMYTFIISCGEYTFEQKFGIRTIRVIQKKDEPGTDSYNLCKALQKTPSGEKYDFNEEFSSFEVILNGEKVLCKGANWVPCEPFVSEESDEKITQILTLAKNAGMNTVRVWGGGIFEKDHFYNECDRLGIFVIQDFLMACGQYPEKDDEFIAQLQKEAEYAVKKLRNHPSLLWWHGDNENAIKGSDTMTDFKGRTASLFGAMPYINKYDYTRPFFTSSPYGGDVYASKTAGTTHHTQFLGSLFDYIKSDSDGKDYLTKLKEFTARFIAEEPTFGASSKESVLKFMNEDDILNKDEI